MVEAGKQANNDSSDQIPQQEQAGRSRVTACRETTIFSKLLASSPKPYPFGGRFHQDLDLLWLSCPPRSSEKYLLPNLTSFIHILNFLGTPALVGRTRSLFSSPSHPPSPPAPCQVQSSLALQSAGANSTLLIGDVKGKFSSLNLRLLITTDALTKPQKYLSSTLYV